MSECVVRMPNPDDCNKCAVRFICSPYEDYWQQDTRRKPTPGQKGCRILSVLPENHGRLADADAAAAIEELRKVNRELRELYEDAVRKLPNRGEWILVSPMVDSVQCSVCGGQLFSAELETPYCPYCGAKMEVQDG